MAPLRTQFPHHSTSARSEQLYNQGIECLESYVEMGEADGLDSGIQLIWEAFTEDSETCQHCPCRGSHRLCNLGMAFSNQYKTTGEGTLLEISIRMFQKATILIPERHHDRASMLQLLGIAHGKKYRATGAMTDLDKSIEILQSALDTTARDHPLRGQILHNLGASYGTKNQKTGAMADLENAFQYFRDALDVLPENHPDRGNRLVGLGTSYMGKYERSKAITDLETAIELLEEALNYDEESRAERLLKIAEIYHTKFHRTKAMTDLKYMIQRSEEALQITRDKTDMIMCLMHMGTGYRDKYEYSAEEALEDLNMAIQLHQKALDTCPDGFVLKANLLQNLSSDYGDKFFKTNSEMDWQMATQRGQEALNSPSSPVSDRLRNIRALFYLFTMAGKWFSAYDIASTAMSLISLLTPRSLDNSDKQHLLTEVVGLASDAAKIALVAGKTTFEALRLLELGRGVILSSLLEMRTEISDLHQKHPEIAEEYMMYRAQFDVTASNSETPHPPRYNADQELDRVIQDIRKLDGFKRFLSPPSESELMAAADYGPIVVINVDNKGCDALIIENHGLRTLPLPDLRREDILKRGIAQPDLELLEWLWETIAGPVLNVLGFTQTPTNGCWRRIWWIPTGPLAKFPIHAAGHHTDGSSKTVLDRAISSYSSSVRTLVHTRQRRSKTTSTHRPEKVVLVSMQETPGQVNLQYAQQEISSLKSLCNSMQLEVRMPEPRRETVLQALRDCEIFHFAGHGNAHPLDPAKSSLLLRDGPMAVESLLEVNFRGHSKPFLAYLSACGTGQVKHETLIDEGLHLISACQLAGFPHVIGTVREVNDSSCLDVATGTYTCMRERGMSDDSVSEGLHRAVRRLRDEWIEKNVASGALLRYRMRRQNMSEDAAPEAIETELPDEDKSKDRDFKICGGENDDDDDDDNETLTPLHWIPYIHVGL